MAPWLSPLSHTASAPVVLSPPSTTTTTSKLRGFVVLTAKPPRRARLASSCSSVSSTSSTASEDEDDDEHDPDNCDPAGLDCSMAYESYAAVTSRYNNSRSGGSPRDLRWSDLNRGVGPRGPRVALAKFLSARPSNQHARRRQLRKGESASSSPGVAENELPEPHALELCLEFLDVDDLVASALVCADFHRVVTSAGHLLSALYSRKWRPSASPPLGAAYHAVPFPEQLEMVRRRDAQQALEYPVVARGAVQQNAADGTYALLNNSMLRSFARGSVESFRGAQPLPVLPCARVLGQQLAYFEVSMKGCGSVGIASLSDAASRGAYGFGSEEHLGWKPVSYGYHGNDGDFVFNDGSAAYGGEWAPLGPAWGAVDAQGDPDAATFTVGCGVDTASGRLFFTLNGTLAGQARVAVLKGEYAAAVSLHSYGDAATLNVGSAPFRFDIEGFCASLQR
ncbi:hypothetical protein PybrP1_008565 [[Pythium] brassicae (nom. inval.)]|nr:hypothetical protein PybrP1_008565 [[Pythium] brassicae (nom. inval.)]